MPCSLVRVALDKWNNEVEEQKDAVGCFILIKDVFWNIGAFKFKGDLARG